MENLENYLDNIDASVTFYTSIASAIMGCVLLAIGIIMYKRKQGNSTGGWICIGLGVLAILSNVPRILTYIL